MTRPACPACAKVAELEYQMAPIARRREAA